MAKASTIFLVGTIILGTMGCNLTRAQESDFPDNWIEDIFGGWMTEQPELWQTQNQVFMPDYAGIAAIAYPPATHGSVRAQILVSYLVLVAKTGGSELTSPMESKLGMKFQDMETQALSWKKSIIYGDDRKAAMLAAAIFAEIEKSAATGENNHSVLQKCWQKVFICFKSESKTPVGECEKIATEIFDQQKC